MGEQGVAVRFRLRHARGAHHAAGAGAVFDDEGLAELGRKPVEHRARHEVYGAAGRDRHDRPDGPRRPFLRRGDRRQGEGEEDQPGQVHPMRAQLVLP
jgi:hypothetical protein